MVKLAMIGAGGYAYELIKRIWTIPEKIELIAVSSNPARKSVGSMECQRRGIPVYANIDELLENVKGHADVIFVPTPIHTHYSLTKQCLENGFDVWLEKPPVATIQEIDKLMGLSKKYGKPVPVAFQSLYSTIMQELKSRIVSGEYGKVLQVSSMAGWKRSDSYYNRSGWAGKLKLNGDWVLDGTINNPLAHMLSNSLYLASSKPGCMSEPVTIEAELYHGHDIESEDTASLRIFTTDKVKIIFNASLCSKTETGCLTVVECEKARIEYKNFNSAKVIFNDGRKEKLVDESEQRIYMLSQLAECYENGTPYAATLETCRPFTLTVNGAFESCGCTHPIDKKYLAISEHGDTIETIIKGMDHILEVSHSSAKLFSEIGVEWSRKSEPFDVRGYKEFPSGRFEI